jgi:CshA-type fibril repeat protein
MKSVNQPTKRKSIAHSQRLVLESRLVFDGAIAVTATTTDTHVDATKQQATANDKSAVSAAVTPTSDPTVNVTVDKAITPASVVDYQPNASTSQPAPSTAPNPADTVVVSTTPSPITDVSSGQVSTVIVVDPRAANAASLIANPPANTEVFTLDPSRDGFQQIDSLLQGQHNIKELDVLSWTDANHTQWLGDTALNSTLTPTVSNALTQWGDSFANQANIVFYGSSNLGSSWLSHVDALTGAQANWAQDSSFNPSDLGSSHTDTVTTQPATQAPHEVIVVDTSIANYQSLVADLHPSANTEIVYINSSQDGITQLVNDLQGQTNISAIQILSHGNQGELILGSTTLNSTNINSYQAQLAEIGKSLAPNGDILLYGCDVAEGASGVAFVNSVASLTHSTVAASTNDTGSAAKGGDWILEYSTGTIDAKTLAAPDYTGELTAVAFANPTASVGAVESQLSVTTIAATGGVAALSYSISGGADAAQFIINSATGALSFVSGHLMSQPQSAAGTNTYNIQITATDGSTSAVENLAVTVSVPNPNTSGFTAAAGTSTYFVPGNPQQMWYLLEQMQPSLVSTINSSQGLHSVVTVAATTNNTIVYYDHFQDGYDATVPIDSVTGQPAAIASTTQVLMGTQLVTENTYVNSTTVSYVLNAGQSIELSTPDVPVTPSTSIINANGQINYEGGDRIYVTGGPVTTDYAVWPQAIGTVFSMAWEIYPAKPDNVSYTIPIGENLGVSSFQFVDLEVQATQNNTVINFQTVNGQTILVDPAMTGVGHYSSITLQEGQSIQLTHVMVGTQVTSNNPLQVLMVTGSTATYESRAFSLTPSGLWTNDYYSAVPSAAGTPTDLYLYNPGSISIRIYYDEAGGTQLIASNGNAYTGYFDIAAHSTVQFSKQINGVTGTAVGYVPQNSAVHLFSIPSGSNANTFWGVGAVDTGATYNWGFSLVPSYLLNTSYTFGWAPQWDFTNQPSTTASLQGGKGAGIFVTPTTNNTTINISYNGDTTVDKTITLNALQTYVIYSPTNDNTGTHITASAPIAAVWGENPATSQPGLPFLDMGYTALPTPPSWMDVAYGVIKTANINALTPDAISSGAPQTVTYTLQVPAYQLITGLSVADTLATGWSYVAGSSVITMPDGSKVTGVTADPTLSTASGVQTMLWSAPQVPSSLSPDSMVTISYAAATSVNIAAGQNQNSVAATATVGGTTETSTAQKDVNAGTTIGGIVFNDVGNGTAGTASNGVLNTGEQGVAGVTVTLSGGGLAAPLTAVSDSNGKFLFDGLTSGTAYTLSVSPSANYSVTGNTLTVTTGTTTLTTATTTTLNSASSSMNPSQNTEVVVDFGLKDNTPNVSGFVKQDPTGTGTMANVGTDAAIAGVTVSLYLDNNGTGVLGAGDTLVATQITSATGAYNFSGLVNGGKYIVVETNPAGNYLSTNDTDANAHSNGYDQIALTAVAGSNTGNNFLDYLVPPNISVSVLTDPNSVNVGGLANAGTGITGATVALYNDVAGTGSYVAGTDTLVASHTMTGTDAGTYTFNGAALGLVAGNKYIVVETNATGYTNTYDTQGVNDKQIAISSLAAAGSTGNTFLEYLLPPSISGFVKTDSSNPDPTGSGAGVAIAGVTVQLYDSTGTTLLQSTTTDATGAYTFSNLTANTTYVVKETVPAGYVATYDTQGSVTDGQITVASLATTGSTGNIFLDYLTPPAAPTITKTVISTSSAFTGNTTGTSTPDLSNGETVTYELVISVPNSRTASNLTVEDVLPATANGANLTYSSAVVKSIGSNLTVATANPTPTVTGTVGSGQTIALNFGNVSSDTNNGVVNTADQIVVWVTATAGIGSSTQISIPTLPVTVAVPTPVHHWALDNASSGTTVGSGSPNPTNTIVDTGSSPVIAGTFGTSFNSTGVAGVFGNALGTYYVTDSATTSQTAANQSYINLASGATALGVDPTQGPFTMTAWFNAPSTQTYAGLIAGAASTATTIESGIYIDASGYIHAQIGGTDVKTTNTYNNGSWYMVSLVKDASGTGAAAQLYIYSATGALLETVNMASTGSNTYSNPGFTLGGGVTGLDFDGAIDDVRIYNSALTSNQLASVAEPYALSHFWSLNGNSTDTGTAATAATNGTLTQSTGASPEALPTYVASAGTQVLNFGSGTGNNTLASYDQLATNDTTLAVAPADTYTISFMFKLNSSDLNTTSGNVMFADGTASSPSVYIGINATGYLYAHVGGNSYSSTTPATAVNVADGQWHMVTLVNNVATGTVSLYLDNGTNSDSTNSTTGTIVATPVILGAGFSSYSAGSPVAGLDFDGSLANVNVYQGSSLTAAEVSALYNASLSISINNGSTVPLANTGEVGYTSGTFTEQNTATAPADIIPTAPTTGGGIKGLVQIDTLGNGASDLGNAGNVGVGSFTNAQGFIVTLTPSTGAPITTTTAYDGSYQFDGLAANLTYTVKITPPTGYYAITDSASNTTDTISGLSVTNGNFTAPENFLIGKAKPTVDLNTADGTYGNANTSAPTGYTGTFVFGGTAVPIANTSANGSLIADNQTTTVLTNLDQLTVTITNAVAGDNLTVGSLPAGISLATPYTYNSTTHTGTLVLSGVASLANYDTALDAIHYSNTVKGSTGGVARTISVQGVADNGATSNTAVATISVQDTVPTAGPDTLTTPENSPVAINVSTLLSLGTVGTGEGPLTFNSITTQPTNGTLSISNGVITYTPNANYTGADSFTYKVADNNGDYATATVGITVTPRSPVIDLNTNDGTPPTSYTGNLVYGSGPVSITAQTPTPLLGNSITDNGTSGSQQLSQLTITLTNPQAGSTEALNVGALPTGIVVSSQTANTIVLSGTASFANYEAALAAITYSNTSSKSVFDAQDTTATTPVPRTITVQGIDSNSISSNLATATINLVDLKPVANPDTFTVQENSGTTNIPVMLGGTVGAGTVTADNQGDGPASIISVTAPKDSNGNIVGTAVIHTAGGSQSIDFTPNANYSGPVSFTYTIADSNGDASTTTVTGTVNFVSQPIATTPDTATTLQNTAVNISVLANDSFPNGKGTPAVTGVSASTISAIGQTATTANGGTVTINNDGTLTYKPSATFSGTDSFYYYVKDATGQTEGGTNAPTLVTVTVTPSVQPVANPDSATVTLGNSVNINALANDVVGANDPVTIQTTPNAIPNFVAQTANGGIVTLNPDGTLKYTSNGTFVGTDTFNYTIKDSNGLSSTTTDTVTVTDTPPVANNDVYQLNTATGSIITPANATIIQSPYTSNTFTVTAANGLLNNDYSPVGANIAVKNYTNGASVDLPAQTLTTANGNTVTVNSDGSFTYTNKNAFTGIDSFNYTITDSAGETATATATLNVISAPNPTAVNDSYTAYRGSTLTVPTATGVITNDTDNGGGHTLTIAAYAQSTAQGGVVAMNPDGSFSYTPPPGFIGNDSFQYQITDGYGDTSTATVNIVVKDAPPVAVNDSYVTQASTGTQITLPIINNDTDPDSTAIIVTALPSASQGVWYMANGTTPLTVGQILTGADQASAVFKPAAGQTSIVPYTDTLTYIDTITIGSTLPTNGTLYLADGVTPVTTGEVLTAAQANSMVFKSNGTAGSSSFTYTATDYDGVNSVAPATVTIKTVSSDTVSAVNDSATTNERTASTGTQAVTINVAANDSSSNSTLNPASVSIVAGNGPTNGSVVVNANGTITYTPNVGYVGTDTFKYSISDNNSQSATATVTVNVDGVNAVNDSYTTATSNAIPENSVALPLSVLNNDTSVPSGGTFTIVSVTQPANGFMDINNSGTQLLYTPKTNWTGTETVTYTIEDSSGNFSTATVTLQVVQTGTPPTLDLNTKDGDYTTTYNTATPAPSGYSNTFVIGRGAVAATDSTATIGSSNTQMAGATITLTNVQDAGQESLAIASLPPGITATSSYDSVAKTVTLTLTGTASKASYDLAIGSLTYNDTAATPNTSVPRDITVSVLDPQGNASNVATSTISLTKPPIAANDTGTYTPNNASTVTVLSNDTAGDTAVGSTVQIVNAPTGSTLSTDGKTLTVPGQGVWSVDNAGAITFTPATNYTGNPTAIQYTVQDAAGHTSNPATVTLTETPTPIAASDTGNYTPNNATTVNVLSNDTAGDTAVGSTVQIVNAPTGSTLSTDGKTLTVPGQGVWSVDNAGAITFTPATNYTGNPTAIQYTVQDAAGHTSNPAIVTLTANNPATATPDNYNVNSGSSVTLTPLTNDSNPAHTAMSVISINGITLTGGAQTITTAHGVVNISTAGVISYAPNAGYVGTDSFTYGMSDGTTTATANETVTVNNPATATPDNYNVNSDSSVTLTPLAGDSNPANTAMSVTSINGVALTGGVQTINTPLGVVSVSAAGVISYTPNAGYVGTDSFTYGMSDGTSTATAMETVTVTANKSPSNLPSNPVSDIASTVGALPAVVKTDNTSVMATSGIGEVVTQPFDFVALPVTNAAINSGASIMLNYPDQGLGIAQYNLEKQNKPLEDEFAIDNALPPEHLSLYVPIRYHDITLTGELRDQVVLELEPYSFSVPEWAFRHTDPNEQLEFEATHPDGSPLPEWLKFNKKTLRFSGVPPKGAINQQVMVTARDSYGNEAHAVFKVYVNRDVAHPTNRPAIAPNKYFGKEKLGVKPVVAKAALTEQVQAAGKLSKLQESRALLDSLKHL